MRITIELPDKLGEELRTRTDDVGLYIREAVSEKIDRENRRRARERIGTHAGTSPEAAALHEENQRFRREGDRHGEQFER